MLSQHQTNFRLLLLLFLYISRLMWAATLTDTRTRCPHNTVHSSAHTQPSSMWHFSYIQFHSDGGILFIFFFCSSLLLFCVFTFAHHSFPLHGCCCYWCCWWCWCKQFYIRLASHLVWQANAHAKIEIRELENICKIVLNTSHHYMTILF